MRYARLLSVVILSSSCKSLLLPAILIFAAMRQRRGSRILTIAPSGSDSAPHPIQSKTSAAQGKAPAGVFTQPCATQLVVLALEEAIERGVIAEADVTEEKLAGFLSRYGRRFYKLPETTDKKIVLERKGEKIPHSVKSEDGKAEVGISRGGDEVFSLTWEKA